MKSADQPDPQSDSFVEALRADLPSASDEARVRARLAALGVTLGAVLTTQSAAASLVAASKASAAAKLTFAARFAALPLATKLGVVTAVSVSAIGAPVWLTRVSDRSTEEPRTSAPQNVGNPRVRAQPSRQTRTVPHELEPAAPFSSQARVPEAGPVRERDTRSTRSSTGVEAPKRGDASQTTAPSSLGEEATLLDATFAALRSGDRLRAVALVEEHTRRFPEGLLRRERERARAKLEGQAPSAAFQSDAVGETKSSGRD